MVTFLLLIDTTHGPEIFRFFGIFKSTNKIPLSFQVALSNFPVCMVWFIKVQEIKLIHCPFNKVVTRYSRGGGGGKVIRTRRLLEKNGIRQHLKKMSPKFSENSRHFKPTGVSEASDFRLQSTIYISCILFEFSQAITTNEMSFIKNKALMAKWLPPPLHYFLSQYLCIFLYLLLLEWSGGSNINRGKPQKKILIFRK